MTRRGIVNQNFGKTASCRHKTGLRRMRSFRRIGSLLARQSVYWTVRRMGGSEQDLPSLQQVTHHLQFLKYYDSRPEFTQPSVVRRAIQR